MKNIKFYVCPDCGNIMTSAGGGELSCCGRRLTAMTAQKADEEHKVNIQCIEDDYYITFPHPMSKDHHILFAAYVTYDKMIFARLYPEQGSEVRIPQLHGGKLYICCSRHGLCVQ